jgi:pimeloyl-ACP methyl ester carboxylesterase
MPTIRVNGVRLHYLRSGAGPDLVMLHGMGSNLAMWHLSLAPQLQRCFRVTTFDLRGHGRSSMPPAGYTTRDLAEDLRALMDGLGIEHADLAGHSLGADIALHFALRYPSRARRLMLLEPGIPALVHARAGGEWEGWARWARDLERLTGLEVPRDRRRDLGYMMRRSIEARSTLGRVAGWPQRKDRVLRLFDTTTLLADHEIVGELTLAALAAIPHLKLLVCDGSSASISSFEVLRRLLINCTPLMVSGPAMPHFAPLEAPPSLMSHVARFLGIEHHLDAVPATPVGIHAHEQI